MDIVFIVVLMTLGMLVGGALFPDAEPEIVILVGMLGCITGLVVAYGVLVFKGSFSRRGKPTSSPRRRAQKGCKPVPYRQRLARFAGGNEKNVMGHKETFQSKMPFWSAIAVFRRVPPKPTELIRRTLLRIRRILNE